MLTSIATYVFFALIALVVAFQLALIAGMPWGEFAWGGKYPGALPGPMRAASIVSIFILSLLGLTVAVRAGVLLPEWRQLATNAIWVVVAYCLLGVLVNAITPSKRERRVWLPVTLVMLACSTAVALS